MASKNLVLGEATLAEFEAGLQGELIRRGDEGYAAARKVWNGSIDKYPALIMRCAAAPDVIHSVQFASSHDLLVAVRGGGHNVAGNAVCDDGLVIDLSAMKGIHVDPLRRRARAQAGLTWGEFDRATQAHGLATTGGLVSSTGIAGFTLGGGVGWLMRKHGLACDNLLSAQVVTADGRWLKANAQEHADLFWGIRGGGGNFGIVTEFEYQLHPVEQVMGGMVLHPASQAQEVLHFFRQATQSMPDELTTLLAFLTAPPAPFVPEALQGRPVVAIVAAYAGPMDRGEQAVRPLKEFGPPAVDLIGPMPYTALQTMLDAGAPPGLQNYWKSGYLNSLHDETIHTLMEYAARTPSPLSQVHLHHLLGAVSRVRPHETAFPHREAPYAFNIVSTWTDPADAERNIRWARSFWEAMQRFSTGGAYVNYLGDEGEERVRAAYGLNYERLAALKKRYDPTNFFRLNQNIRPAEYQVNQIKLNDSPITGV